MLRRVRFRCLAWVARRRILGALLAGYVLRRGKRYSTTITPGIDAEFKADIESSFGTEE